MGDAVSHAPAKQPAGYGRLARNSAILLTGARMLTRTLTAAQLFAYYSIQGRTDTGVIGIGMTTLAAVEVFSQFGVRKALVQKPGDIDTYFPTAFTAELMRGVVIAAAMFLLAPFIAAWFRAPDATAILRTFALIPLLRGFTAIRTVKLERALDFKRLVVLDLITPAVDFVVTVACLIIHPSLFALVWGKLAGAAWAAGVSYLLVEKADRPGWNTHHFIDLSRFGRWVLLAGIVGLILTRGSDFVAGRLLTTAEFGDLTLATVIAIMPMMEINNVLNRVAFPAYSKIQENRARLRQVFVPTFFSATLVILGMMLAVALCAPALVYFLRGYDDWEFIWLIQLLAIWGACRALGGSTSAVFLACGKPGYVSYYHAIMLIILAATIYPLTQHAGLLGVGGTLAVVGLTAQTLRYGLVARLIESRASALYRQTLPVFGIAFAAYLVSTAALNGLFYFAPRVIQVLLLPLLGGVCYAAGVLVLDRVAGFPVLGALNGVLRGRAPTPPPSPASA